MNTPEQTKPIPSDEPADYSQPVAYDTQGRPLYAHPPRDETAAPQSDEHPQVVYMTRPAEPMAQHISDSARQRHEESVAKYPGLNLSEGEYVISEVARHPIGLFSIWLIVMLTLGAVFVGGPIVVATIAPGFLASLQPTAVTNGLLFLVLLAIFFVLGGIIATVVYRGNRFYLTNESVIQRIQHDLLSHKEQTVSLANIEDASYNMRGLVQTLCQYGSIRLSTEGDETTYRFSFVANPKRQIDLLNNAVEAFKNGRPVDAG